VTGGLLRKTMQRPLLFAGTRVATHALEPVALPVHLEERAYSVRRREAVLLALSGAFVWISAASYSLASSGRIGLEHLWAPGAWGLLLLGGHLLFNRLLPLRDPLFFPISGLSMGWGLVLVDRLAPNFMPRQALSVVVSLFVMMVVAILPRPRPGDPAGLRWLRRYRYTWLVFGLGLLGVTLVFGVNPSGAELRFWLGATLPVVGPVYFQPSELLKLLAVVFLASYMAEKEALISLSYVRIGPFELARPPLAYLAPLLLMWGLSLVLLGWQRDLGAATLFLLVFLVMLYLASGRWEAVASGLALLAAMAVTAYLLPLAQLDVVRLRIDSWLNPWPDAQGNAFQIVQSLIALAAGGLVGQGVGQGYPGYVPVVHSDFVLAAIGEEWGLVGTLVVLVCIAVLVYRGLRVAISARYPFLAFLLAGIATVIGVQTLIIMGGTTRVLPLTGVTLPFLSYGGSSLLVSAIMIGLMLKGSHEVMGQ
jgi:cell division protein FtsW (lipid II flippase)